MAPGQPALLLWTLNKEGKAEREREILNITGPSDFLPPGSPPCCVDWSKDYSAGELTAFSLTGIYSPQHTSLWGQFMFKPQHPAINRNKPQKQAAAWHVRDHVPALHICWFCVQGSSRSQIAGLGVGSVVESLPSGRKA